MNDSFDDKLPHHAQDPDDMVAMGSIDEELNEPRAQVRAAARAGAAGAAPGRGLDNLAFVMDVPVEVTVEIGRRTMKIAEVLRLGNGSVLELDKASGEPLDIFVNNRLVARGEAVVVGERYGIRITEVLVTDEGQVGL
jgi:flagellar motor switch protein FliN/FliY